MDKLILNLQDVKDMPDFIRKLCQFCELEGATANGALYVDVDPETMTPITVECRSSVPILNNRPWFKRRPGGDA
jgi:hypothetical protein